MNLRKLHFYKGYGNYLLLIFLYRWGGKMLKIKNQTEKTAELYISGDIVDDMEGNIFSEMFSNKDGYEFPKDIKRQLDSVKDKSLTVFINSYGGSVAAGVAMANMIARHPKPTTAIVDGFCCSIATQIFFSADTCKMPTNAYLMIHKPEVAISGNAIDFRKAAYALDTIQRGLEKTYQKKKVAGVSDKEITEIMNQETWLTGEEAIKYFQIELLESMKVVNCAGSIEKLRKFGIRNIPSSLNFVKTDFNLASEQCNQKALNEDLSKLPSKNHIEPSKKIKIALARAKSVLI